MSPVVKMESPTVKVPPMQDLTIENITENTNIINGQCEDPRTRFLLERLVTHLHDFARETRLSHEEWRTGIDFLTRVGQMCSNVRQEFILLSDILGLSLLVDSIDHPKPKDATEGSVLGPFHTIDAEDMPHGDEMSRDAKGEPCLVLCAIKDRKGNPIPDVKIDIWETDSSGHYDVQYKDRQRPDGRAVMHSDVNGAFWFKAIKPVSYPIPHDGPVGQLLKKLHRHPFRPAHMHFMFEKPGWDHLITALYSRGDPYETSDAVFGVKASLLCDFEPADDATAKKYGVEKGIPVLQWNFVMVTEEESNGLRMANSRTALEALGQKVEFINGLPVPAVD